MGEDGRKEDTRGWEEKRKEEERGGERRKEEGRETTIEPAAAAFL